MDHEFGNISGWTKDKLNRVEKYLDRYLTVLSKKNFELEYVDAFAGSGRIARKRIDIASETLFDDESVVLKEFIDGSARLALNTSRPFDRYTFIEKDRARCAELETLRDEFPALSGRIKVICDEANNVVRKLCEGDWIAHHRRAVMFLDPYGAQVAWKTIESIAKTQAIDLWILLPIGTINRLLNRNGRIQEGRKRRLDTLFGDNSWFERLYVPDKNVGLFQPDDAIRFRKTGDPFPIIGDYFIDRLRTIFAEVAPNPLIMRNRNNSPIFLLCFAAGNPTGAPIATRIAKHILKM